MEAYIKRINLSWKEVHKDTKNLVKQISKGSIKFKGIVSLTRGGMCPAAIISRIMDIKLIDTLCISSYTISEETTIGDSRKASIKLIKEPKLALADLGEEWLLVDDLVDTGATAQYAKKLMPKILIACLYTKPLGRKTADYYIREFSQDTWVTFPWELND